MKTQKLKIKIVMLGGKTCELKFSDDHQARDMYDLLRNTMVFANEAIKHVELV